jgi:hypothetical protein
MRSLKHIERFDWRRENLVICKRLGSQSRLSQETPRYLKTVD